MSRDCAARPRAPSTLQRAGVVDLFDCIEGRSEFSTHDARSPNRTRLSAAATIASSRERGDQPSRRMAFSLVAFSLRPSMDNMPFIAGLAAPPGAPSGSAAPASKPCPPRHPGALAGASRRRPSKGCHRPRPDVGSTDALKRRIGSQRQGQVSRRELIRRSRLVLRWPHDPMELIRISVATLPSLARQIARHRPPASSTMMSPASSQNSGRRK
jgi:hypothetical protein